MGRGSHLDPRSSCGGMGQPCPTFPAWVWRDCPSPPLWIQGEPIVGGMAIPKTNLDPESTPDNLIGQLKPRTGLLSRRAAVHKHDYDINPEVKSARRIPFAPE